MRDMTRFFFFLSFPKPSGWEWRKKMKDKDKLSCVNSHAMPYYVPDSQQLVCNMRFPSWHQMSGKTAKRNSLHSLQSSRPTLYRMSPLPVSPSSLSSSPLSPSLALEIEPSQVIETLSTIGLLGYEMINHFKCFQLCLRLSLFYTLAKQDTNYRLFSKVENKGVA